MRQALTMAICWWAIPLIHKRRFWQFSLFCCLGGLFHFTGFLFIAVYFLPKINFSKNFLLIVIPVLFIISLSGLTDKLILILMEHGGYFFGFEDKIANYISGNKYSRNINPLNFLEIAPFLYFAIKYRKDMCRTENGSFFFNMLVLYVLFMILTMNFPALIRISSYYIYSFFYIINFLFKRTKIYSNRIIYGYAFSTYFLVYGIRLLSKMRIANEYNLFFLN